MALLHPLRLATTRVLGVATSVLDRENSALDRVDQNVLGREVWVVAPGAEELDGLRENMLVLCFGLSMVFGDWDAYAVVFGVDVEEAGFFDVVAGGVFGKAGDVDNAEAGGVVGLVGEAVEGLCGGQYLVFQWECLLVVAYVLIVVNGLLRRLVVASVDGSFQVADVEDVGRSVVDETSDLAGRRTSLL